MTTLTLKKPLNENTELLKTIIEQNNRIIHLLEKQQKNNSRNNKPHTSEKNYNVVIDMDGALEIMKGFGDGTNHETLKKLVSHIRKWSSTDIEKIREELVNRGLVRKHLNSFDAFINKAKGINNR